jgi:ADP-ribosyl-[dinitrogen reductase] hydrolase
MNKDKIFGGIFGLIVGDALGVPVEFVPREVLKKNPVTDMIGYGTYNQPPGTWSDDSSLTLCLVDSLCNGFNLNDIAKKFIKWYEEAYWTPFGEVFDVGNTTRIAINNLIYGIPPEKAGPSDEKSNGNGSLMRILPISFYVKNLDLDEQFDIPHKVSSITHGHPRSLIACGYYVQFIASRDAWRRTLLPHPLEMS